MKRKIVNIPVFIYFIIATVIILLLFPREGKFRYSFTEGRPWSYSLLTAPFDFPVYKTDAEIKQEEDSINRYFTPYFALDAEVEFRQLSDLNETHASSGSWNGENKR